MEFKDKTEEYIMTCATYSILYANDTSCNEMLAIKPLIERTQDKELIKKYHAIEKRARKYLHGINEIASGHEWFLSDFNLEMDDMINPIRDRLETEIKNIFNSNVGVEDSLYPSIEMARTMAHIGYNNYRLATAIAGKHSNKVGLLKNCMIEGILEIPNIADDMAKWAYRKIDANIDFNDYHKLKEIIKELINKLSDFHKIIEYYTTANDNE